MPSGRTRYPITIRRIKLELAIETKATIKTNGVIGSGSPPSKYKSPCPILTRFAHKPRKFQANQIGKEETGVQELQELQELQEFRSTPRGERVKI